MTKDILKETFWGNPVSDYAIALGILIGGWILVKIIQIVVIRRLRRLAEKTTTTIDDFLLDLVKKVLLPLAYFGLLFVSLNSLELTDYVKKGVQIVGTALLTIFAARFFTAIIGYGFKMYWTQRGQSLALERSLNGILRVTKVLVWGLAIAFFLDNLGFKITAVMAGLGVGGVAVALAAQAVLGDLFSYFAILFDRPFEAGDFIIVDDLLGTVDHIGIKTTRISSLGGEQLVFSNSDLTNSRVRNYKRMAKRRVVFKLGVTYQTTLEQLKEIPKMVRGIIEQQKEAECDRVHFSSYGDFSLIFEVVYYVMGSDYNKYMDIQQAINFAIKESFKKSGIEFAYPTQTLFVEKPAKGGKQS